MSDDPVTAREMIAAYRATVRPPSAARDRMAQALAAAAVAPVIPLRPAPPRRTTAVWLALAAALALVAASTYWLASARSGLQVETPGLLMAPHDDRPNGGAPTPRDEPAAPITTPRDDSPDRATPRADNPITTPHDDSADRAAPRADDPITTPHDDSPDRATSRADDPITAPPDDATDRTDEPAAPAITPEPPRRARPRPTDEPAAAKDPVLAELELVQRIKGALDGDRPTEALRLIDRHVRTFARGSLVEERDALRVTALCAAGERAHGLREQQAFLLAYPRSAYRDRVRAACAD